MKLKLTYALSFFLFAIAMNVNAQTSGNKNYFQPNIFPLAPNSSAFTKFGNYPVNLYSGLPDISIPLYDIQAGGLSMPITLSYHASGNRIPDVASWVGLGWSINTGGSITRNIMGLPDDNGYLQGDMHYVDNLVSGGPVTNANLDFFHATIATRGWDNMPDIFSYQIPGYSGKFFFDGTNNYKVEKIPFSPINIVGLTHGSAAGFNITDDHGNQFILGRNYTETTGTPVGGGFPPMNAISAWMLEQMISQNRRDTINFSYSSTSFTYPDGLSETQTVEDSYQVFYPPGNPSYVNSGQPPVILNNPSTVAEQQLKTITFRNGKVDFILHPTGRMDIGNNQYASSTVRYLDTIKVSIYNFSSKKYEVQKSVVFYQSYFNPGVIGAQRLKLDSIQIRDKAGSIIQHYRFTYNQTVNLPAYGSYARDFWGYYNGKTSATDLIPQTTIQINTPQNINNPITYTTIGSNDPTSRNPDSNYMQANILNRIDYPTGGYSVFTYQTNQYQDSNNNLQLAGGLRVSSINNYDSPAATVPAWVKTYKYNIARANFITNGMPLLYNGIFQNAQTYRWWISLNTPAAPQGVEMTHSKRVRQFFAQPNEDLAPDGIPVGYSVVTEYEGTPANNTGKIVYTYRDGDGHYDGFQTAARSGIPIAYSFFFLRGQLLDKATHLRKSDGTYQIVKDESNGYTAFPLRYYNRVGLAIGQFNYNDGYLQGGVAYPNQQLPDDVSSNTYSYDYYAIVSDDNHLTGTTIKIYDTNDPTKYTSSSVTYQYDDTTHQQIAYTTHTDSKGNTRTSTNKYAYNYAAGNAVIDTMVNRHMYAEPIEKTETYTSSSGTATTASQLNQFQYGTIPYSVVPAKISILNIPTPVTNFTPSGVVSGSLTSDSRYAQMISFDQYDTKNNIAQYTPRNATPVSILWDYMYELPVAQIKNAINNTYPQVAYTSFEAPRNTGWYYTGTPVTDVTAPTGSMVYPLSAGSVTLTYFDNTQTYVISLWSNNGAPTIYCGSYLTGTPLRAANGWTYYEYPVPAGAGGITISGSTAIDELRLYPRVAQMTTYAYDPSGLRSITDTKGEINYFEYDPFQRLKNVKDWNGNIVKNYGYHTYDQVVPNDAIASTTFTRDNCPAGTVAQSTTYSVPANRYFSSTKASANAQAQYDLQTNGQALADNPAICGCPIQTITFTLTNSTGLSGFTASFSGGTNPTYNFSASSGPVQVQVPAGTYTSVSINAVGSNTHTFTLGTRTPITDHSATFNTVVIANGGSELNLSIQ